MSDLHLALAMLMITLTSCGSVAREDDAHGTGSPRVVAPRANIDASEAPESEPDASTAPDASVANAPTKPAAQPDASAAPDSSVANAPATPTAEPDAGAAPDSSVADAPTAPEGWIFTKDLANARGLGGVPLTGSARTSYGVLYRGQTLALSAAGCEEFASLRIRSVVDLRDPVERVFSRNADCVRNAASILTAPLGSSSDYLDYISKQGGLDSIAATFAVLGDPAAYPVYIHCTYGRDRTGVVSALILSALGASRTAIVDEYNRSSATVGSSPDSLERVLDKVDELGGIEAFLKGAGVTSAQLETLRAVVIAGRK